MLSNFYLVAGLYLPVCRTMMLSHVATQSQGHQEYALLRWQPLTSPTFCRLQAHCAWPRVECLPWHGSRSRHSSSHCWLTAGCALAFPVHADCITRLNYASKGYATWACMPSVPPSVPGSLLREFWIHRIGLIHMPFSQLWLGILEKVSTA